MEGKAMYRKLRSYLVGPELRTLPHTQFAIVAEGDHLGLERGANTHEPGSTPPAKASAGASSKLLRAYLAMGARMCGLPAIDRELSNTAVHEIADPARGLKPFDGDHPSWLKLHD